ncbi:hypothetical protein WA158_004986 [Blastocystis sp. Blastoise]
MSNDDAFKDNIEVILSENKFGSALTYSQKRSIFGRYEDNSIREFQRHYLHFDDIQTIQATTAIEFSPDGLYFASSHSDHSVRIFEYPSCKPYASFFGHPRTPWTIRWHPRDYSLLASACLGGTIIIWNIYTKKIAYKVTLETMSEIRSIDFHPLVDLLCIASGTSIYMWDYKNSRLLHVYDIEPLLAAYVRFAARGHFLIVGEKQSLLYPSTSLKLYLVEIDSKPYNDSFIHFHFNIPGTILTKEAYLYSEHGFDLTTCGLYLIVPLGPEYVPTISSSSYPSFGPYIDTYKRTKYYNRNSSNGDSLNNTKDQYNRYFRNNNNSTSFTSSTSSPYKSSSCTDNMQVHSIGTQREVQCRIALLSLEPKHFGKILDYVNFKEPVDIISIQFSPSNTYICISGSSQYPMLSTQYPFLRVIRITDWKVMYESTEKSISPNTAVFSKNQMGILCGSANEIIAVIHNNDIPSSTYIKETLVFDDSDESYEDDNTLQSTNHSQEP